MVDTSLAYEALRADLYEVQSGSTANQSYFVQYGKEGEFWSCTCTGWATSRNKAGGMGHMGKCKHVTLIQSVAELERQKVRERQARTLQRLAVDLATEI